MDKQVLAGKTVRIDSGNAGSFTQTTFEDFNKDWWSSNGQAGKPHVAPNFNNAEISKFDPTPKIVAAMKEVLTKDLHMRITNAASADYVVQLGGSWGIRHHPIALTNYNIFYRAHFNLEGQEKVGSKYPVYEWFTCSRQTDSKYSYDEVFADHAAAVKEMLKPVAGECSSELTQKLLQEASKQ